MPEEALKLFSFLDMDEEAIIVIHAETEEEARVAATEFWLKFCHLQRQDLPDNCYDEDGNLNMQLLPGTYAEEDGMFISMF
jgi:hypothetical protein